MAIDRALDVRLLGNQVEELIECLEYIECQVPEECRERVRKNVLQLEGAVASAIKRDQVLNAALQLPAGMRFGAR
jgi:hypothetical protein